MKVIMVHNAYGKFSGEEAVVRDITSLLISKGHDVVKFERSSAELPNLKFGTFRSFFSGIYNPWARIQFKNALAIEHPEIIHIHNLFPLISPSILSVAKSAGIPVVMTVHNYRLVCPNGLHYTTGRICEDCNGGKEYFCVINNCEQSIPKSIGYALRNWFARIRRSFYDNVTLFCCLTHFQKNRLTHAGFPADRISIIPNMVMIPKQTTTSQSGKYVGYVGRISGEKGISILFTAAKVCPDIMFNLAGAYTSMPDIVNQASANINLLGHCNTESLKEFYLHCRFIVLPSVCFEGFPTVLVEAMLYGKAVICSNIGGLPEIVDDGVTGLLVEPGNSSDLADKIRYLWENPDLCDKMGEAGRQKVLKEYSPQQYYDRLMDAYQKAILLCTS